MYLVLGICVILGLLVYTKGILDARGSFVASLIGFLVYYFSGSFAWLSVLFIFLFVSFIATKYKFEIKKKLRVAEGRSGQRNVVNVLANGLVFTAFAFLFYFGNSDIFKAGYLAALATVTGDTLSSEIGVLSRSRPVLITNFKEVLPGTDGGITLTGEIAGILGTLLIAISAWILGISSLGFALSASLIGGFLGFNFDSLMGAIFERHGLMGNASVNLISSIAGSIAGITAIIAIAALSITSIAL